MNTEQDRETLIADAREWPRDGVNEGPLINALADAIEALVKERDELAAVIEKAKLAPAQRVPNAVGLSGTVGDVLREAPADVLREHDAALIESLADEEVPAAVEARRWLRERARQVREGEA